MKNIFWSVSALLLGLAVVSCSEEPLLPTPVPAGATATALTSRVLFAHASPDAPSLSILVNNAAMATLSFGQTSTGGYMNIPVNSVQLRGKATAGSIGGTLGTSDLVYRTLNATNDNNFSFIAGTRYTIFVSDSIDRPAATILAGTPAVPTPVLGGTNRGGCQFFLTTDILPAAIPADSAFVRFVHLAPGAPAVTVRTRVAGTTGAYTGTVIAGAGAVAFRNGNTNGAAQAVTFNRIRANNYDVQVLVGTTPVLTLPGVAIPAGRIITIVARGFANGARPAAQRLGVMTVAHN